MFAHCRAFKQRVQRGNKKNAHLRKVYASSGPLSASRPRLPCLRWDCWCACATTDM